MDGVGGNLNSFCRTPICFSLRIPTYDTFCVEPSRLLLPSLDFGAGLSRLFLNFHPGHDTYSYVDALFANKSIPSPEDPVYDNHDDHD